MNTSSSPSETTPNKAELSRVRRRNRRMLKDRLARYCMGVGGISVIIAIVLIFFYLVIIVIPLFGGADITKVASYSVPGDKANTLFFATEEQTEIGLRVADNKQVLFFDTASGSVVSSETLPIPEEVQITSFAHGDLASNIVALGLSDGTALMVRHAYRTTYPDGKRTITPSLEYPVSDQPIAINRTDNAIVKLAVQLSEDGATVIGVSDQGEANMVSFAKEESFFDEDEDATWERTDATFTLDEGKISHVLLDQLQSTAYIASDTGKLGFFDIRDKSSPKLVQEQAVVPRGDSIQTLSFLTGSISVMVGSSSGQVSQWFPVRDKNNHTTLEHIRDFQLEEDAITTIVAEQRRKGFLVADDSGNIGLYHSTAHRTILIEDVSEGTIRHVALSPRADAMLFEDQTGTVQFWKVDNEHPEVSWSSLWQKVWYESYSEPTFTWQSSSASNDFEPKFSLMPLSFGTLKAAFYAMLFAIPLSLMAAIYTSYFMTPSMRQVVKPSIETMEALPTVILGFLAGLWLAPLIEVNLPGVFSLLLSMPLGVLCAAYAWDKLPDSIHHRVPNGWQALLMMPVVALIGWGSLSISLPLENFLFDGDMKLWMSSELGIGFDQRNSIVVGLAMGFAVIPTIFSITEDAIFSVPKALTNGSLALGGTQWQSLTRVVLLTASPGIFSAIMIGMGRAVGETMIVLMATGNTPVMDFSVFQGMRTLSANVAVEMPESELNSTHYRILFLAALVLFMFTFVFNTIAEIVRQRLRDKYSSI